MDHKAGFVSIVGKPNAGKSTLMNVLMGEKLSIVTPKAQTTRHRILGILSEEDYQIVFSDTPGILTPSYELHNHMMKYVNSSLGDADVILLVIDGSEPVDETLLTKKLIFSPAIVYFLLNKTDLLSPDKLTKILADWKKLIPETWIVMEISALKKEKTTYLLEQVLDKMPIHPAFYDKEEITDRSERFVASEIIREQIFLLYSQEIPYSSEVVITSFKDKGDILHISADIVVERDTQKAIIIGPKAESIKKLGIRSRENLETFFGKKIFLETFAKVVKDWRKNELQLKYFGYNQHD